MTPEEVVAIQLAGLREERGDLAGVGQCFAFASPLNREVTGPLQRFAAMVANEPYRKLLAPQKALIGKTTIRGNRAFVLTSLVDEEREFASFQFVLTRQDAPPYVDCWMTDAVLQVAAAKSEPPTRRVPPLGPNPAI